MKFGKLADISQVDFELPQDHPQTVKVLSGKPSDGFHLFYGCPAWGCKDWVGKIYPSKAKPAEFLKYYSEQFNTIEFNTTHYRIPDEATVEKWKRESASSFRFCPKIPQSISHADNLRNIAQITHQFVQAVRGLEEKLGICFMQLPPDFSPSRADELMNFLKNFPLPLAIEFRHPDWFLGKSEAEKVFQYMEEKAFSTVITDVAGRRDVLHMRLTSDLAIIRFVGNDLHPTDFSRLKGWSERLKKWRNRGVKSVYFFLHEPDDVHCPELAKGFIEEMNARLNLDLPAIKFYPKHIQTSLF